MAFLIFFCGWVGPLYAGTDALQPVLIGSLEGKASVGPLLYEDSFENIDRWSVQVESKDLDSEPSVKVHDNTLDALVPHRGATIWFREKLEGPVAIIYQVRAPKAHTPGAVPRDINNFWHMSAGPDAMLSNDRYNGWFVTYHELLGYYASIGGRDNTTTRFRRYPRMARGKPVDHIALNDKDGKEPYLITPGTLHTIQLVAMDGTAQHIFDGKLVYEISYGDTVQVRTAEGDHKKVTYTREQYPPYTEGWFGFRMKSTHLIYSNFRVFRLEPNK